MAASSVPMASASSRPLPRSSHETLAGSPSVCSMKTQTQTLSEELRSNQVPPVEASPLPQSIPGTAGRAATITGDLTIVPDSRGNSLLIRANRSDFELIQAAVAQIDVRPPQVLIEVVIVEARRDRSFSLGIEASIADKHVKGTDNTTVGGSYTPGSTGLGDFTLKLMRAGDYDLNATIRAAVGRGQARSASQRGHAHAQGDLERAALRGLSCRCSDPRGTQTPC